MSSYKPLTEENCKDFKNFKYSEFKCKCGGKYCNGYPVPFSYELAKNLQNVRSHFGKALVITSPLRCETWNSKQGGVKNSKHKKGWACDFYISGVSYNDLANYVKKLPYFNYCYRVKKNQNVIHYDINPPSYTEESKNNNEVEDLKSKITELETKISEYDKEILNLKKEKEELNQDIAELTNFNSELEAKLQDTINNTPNYKQVYKASKNAKYNIIIKLKENQNVYVDKM